ncbi:outer membrane beta-barrel protein [Hymenobacter sp. AT01-02]|uniref:outer membrane beta-barrel protein n=1 Tax=Hymenobacter sp. AT01-02 TaxID=1571877 RepID=UPI00092F307A|nr:outer membrane beta-barrel protein [Hymenobacter sp. AT01-02]
MPTYALELRLANKNAWSISSGFSYSRMRTHLTKTKPAQLGTVNSGQLLALPASVEVNSLQIPILLRYTIGHHTVQPYLAAGPKIGMFTNNRTTLSYTTLTYVSGSNSYRNDVVTATPLVRQKTNPTLSGIVRLGVQIKAFTRISPLLEIQYTKGRNRDNYSGVQYTALGQLEKIGPMYYQAFSAVAGLEF